MLQHFNAASFEEAIAGGKPVLVDFFADWCGPCRLVSPVLDEIARERSDVKIAKINVDKESDLAGRFGVMSIPTLIVLKDGKVVEQAIGARGKADISAMVKRHL